MSSQYQYPETLVATFKHLRNERARNDAEYSTKTETQLITNQITSSVQNLSEELTNDLTQTQNQLDELQQYSDQTFAIINGKNDEQDQELINIQTQADSIQNNLQTNYYQKTETYNRIEIDNKIQEGSGSGFSDRIQSNDGQVSIKVQNDDPWKIMCRVGTDETNTDNIVFQNFTLNDNTNPEFQDFAVLAANQFIVRRSKEDMILADFDYWSDAQMVPTLKILNQCVNLPLKSRIEQLEYFKVDSSNYESDKTQLVEDLNNKVAYDGQTNSIDMKSNIPSYQYSFPIFNYNLDPAISAQADWIMPKSYTDTSISQLQTYVNTQNTTLSNNLSNNYYSKTQTDDNFYNKTQTDALIASQSGSQMQIPETIWNKYNSSSQNTVRQVNNNTEFYNAVQSSIDFDTINIMSNMTITSEMAVTKKLRITSSNNSKITFNADVGWFYIQSSDVLVDNLQFENTNLGTNANIINVYEQTDNVYIIANTFLTNEFAISTSSSGNVYIFGNQFTFWPSSPIDTHRFINVVKVAQNKVLSIQYNTVQGHSSTAFVYIGNTTALNLQGTLQLKYNSNTTTPIQRVMMIEIIPDSISLDIQYNKFYTSNGFIQLYFGNSIPFLTGFKSIILHKNQELGNVNSKGYLALDSANSSGCSIIQTAKIYEKDNVPINSIRADYTSFASVSNILTYSTTKFTQPVAIYQLLPYEITKESQTVDLSPYYTKTESDAKFKLQTTYDKMIKDTNNNAVFINNDGDIEIMKNLESHLKISYDPNHDTDKPNVGMTQFNYLKNDAFHGFINPQNNNKTGLVISNDQGANPSGNLSLSEQVPALQFFRDGVERLNISSHQQSTTSNDLNIWSKNSRMSLISDGDLWMNAYQILQDGTITYYPYLRCNTNVNSVKLQFYQKSAYHSSLPAITADDTDQNTLVPISLMKLYVADQISQIPDSGSGSIQDQIRTQSQFNQLVISDINNAILFNSNNRQPYTIQYDYNANRIMVGSQSAIVNQIFTTDMRFTNYLTGQKMNISDKVYFEEPPQLPSTTIVSQDFDSIPIRSFLIKSDIDIMRNNSYFGSIYANIQRKSGQIDSENLDYMSMKLNDITDAFTFQNKSNNTIQQLEAKNKLRLRGSGIELYNNTNEQIVMNLQSNGLSYLHTPFIYDSSVLSNLTSQNSLIHKDYVDNLLNNYYTKLLTYSKTEVDNLIDDISQIYSQDKLTYLTLTTRRGYLSWNGQQYLNIELQDDNVTSTIENKIVNGKMEFKTPSQDFSFIGKIKQTYDVQSSDVSTCVANKGYVDSTVEQLRLESFNNIYNSLTAENRRKLEVNEIGNLTYKNLDTNTDILSIYNSGSQANIFTAGGLQFDSQPKIAFNGIQYSALDNLQLVTKQQVQQAIDGTSFNSTQLVSPDETIKAQVLNGQGLAISANNQAKMYIDDPNDDGKYQIYSPTEAVSNISQLMPYAMIPKNIFLQYLPQTIRLQWSSTGDAWPIPSNATFTIRQPNPSIIQTTGIVINNPGTGGASNYDGNIEINLVSAQTDFDQYNWQANLMFNELLTSPSIFQRAQLNCNVSLINLSKIRICLVDNFGETANQNGNYFLYLTRTLNNW